jgi:hypothetical protein
MVVDYEAIRRVLGAETEERFGAFCENAGDSYDAPGLVCMAFERHAADPTRTVADYVNDLLDQWDAYQAA